MRITKVAVEYSELRSTGHPEFGNKRYGVGYEAEVSEDDGTGIRDAAQVCRCKLMERAMRDVKLLHGDKVGCVELKIHTHDVPF